MRQRSPRPAEKIANTHSWNMMKNAIMEENSSRYVAAFPTARRENCHYAQLEHVGKRNRGRKYLAICVINPHGPQRKLTLRKAGT
jgi:hypothetical protein